MEWKDCSTVSQSAPSLGERGAGAGPELLKEGLEEGIATKEGSLVFFAAPIRCTEPDDASPSVSTAGADSASR